MDMIKLLQRESAEALRNVREANRHEMPRIREEANAVHLEWREQLANVKKELESVGDNQEVVGWITTVSMSLVASSRQVLTIVTPSMNLFI